MRSIFVISSPTGLGVALLLSAHPVLTTFWTITKYVETTSTPYVYPDIYDIYNITRTIQSSAALTLVGTATSTRIYSLYNVTVIYIYIDPAVVLDKDLIPTSTYDETTRTTVYKVPVLYTAPSYCPTPSTVTSTALAIIPDIATDAVTPTSIATYTDDTGITTVTAFLSLNAVPADDIYTYVHEIPCGGGHSPSAAASNSTSTGYNLVNPQILLEAILASVLGLLSLIFVSSCFWFRRFMLGRPALRWTWNPVPIFVLQILPARSKRSQTLLERQWQAVSYGKKIHLLSKWLFVPSHLMDFVDPGPEFDGEYSGQFTGTFEPLY